MKLKRENFVKAETGGTITYKYTYEGQDFFILHSGASPNKKFEVFSGKTDDKQNLFETDNTLDAWNKFEDMISEAEPKQDSESNFAKNPQSSPAVLPLLAIGYNNNTGKYDCVLFGLTENKEQLKAFEFNLSKTALPDVIPNNVFVVNWGLEEVPMILKCEVLLKPYESVEYEEDKTKKVFFFIPKSIVEQGGEKGGESDGDGEGGGEGMGKGKKESKDKKDGGEKGGEKGEGENEGGEKGEGEGQGEGQGQGEGESGEGDSGGDGDGQVEVGGKSSKKESEDNTGKIGGANKNDENLANKSYPQIGKVIEVIGEVEDTPPSIVMDFFRNPTTGSYFLESSNMTRIKSQLGLPDDTTTSDLTNYIIKSLS